MRYIIVDLEATCWENVRDAKRMEIIEIGAVELPSSGEPPTREFNRFVRPVSSPILSDFCRDLTSIRQKDVDGADPFSTVILEFLDWIGDEPYTLVSWGGYDQSQFRIDCRRHSVPFPNSFENHLNLKKAFAEVMSVKLCGMAKALSIAGIRQEGTHHRGIDDARNIAKLANLILPVLETRELVV